MAHTFSLPQTANSTDTTELLHHSFRMLQTGQISEERLTRFLIQLLQSNALTPTEWGMPLSVSFREAAEARLHAARHRRPATRADLRSYTQRFLRFSNWAERPLFSISPAECRELLETHFNCSAHVYGKALVLLHGIFAYAQRQGWCSKNPTDGLESPPIREESLTPLNLAQIRALLRACRRPRLQCMSAPLRLMLWCGIRPAEVQRLRWGDIDTSEGCVYIEPSHSKTGGARAVPLRGGALALSEECRGADDFIAPRCWQRLWKELRQSARLSPWRQDTLRHTFASMHLKRFHNLGLLQEEMGHRDSSLLRARYLNLRTVKNAEANIFFSPHFK